MSTNKSKQNIETKEELKETSKELFNKCKNVVKQQGIKCKMNDCLSERRKLYAKLGEMFYNLNKDEDTLEECYKEVINDIKVIENKYCELENDLILYSDYKICKHCSDKIKRMISSVLPVEIFVNKN